MSKPSSFHYGDFLCGLLGLKIIQLFSPEIGRPWPIWWLVILGIVILLLWVREI